MAVSNGFLDQIAELLASLGHVTARKMFGGASLYCDGTIFAIVEDDVLYFKGDETSKRRYEDEGLKQFDYEGKTGPVSMPYWRAPERLFDEQDEMLEWAREALSASANGARSKTAKTRKAAASVTDGGAPPVKRAKTLAKAPRTSMQKRKTPTR
jgi:DNA transformation protein